MCGILVTAPFVLGHPQGKHPKKGATVPKRVKNATELSTPMSGGSGENGILPIQDGWNKTGSHDPPESENVGGPEPQQEEDEEVDYDYYGYAWDYKNEQTADGSGKEPEGDDSPVATCGAGEEEDKEGR